MKPGYVYAQREMRFSQTLELIRHLCQVFRYPRDAQREGPMLSFLCMQRKLDTEKA